jgi:hypothetical protein
MAFFEWSMEVANAAAWTIRASLGASYGLRKT